MFKISKEVDMNEQPTLVACSRLSVAVTYNHVYIDEILC